MTAGSRRNGGVFQRNEDDAAAGDDIVDDESTTDRLQSDYTIFSPGDIENDEDDSSPSINHHQHHGFNRTVHTKQFGNIDAFPQFKTKRPTT